MFIVLAIIQSNLFTVNRDAHGDELVDEGIAYPAHGKRIDKDYGNVHNVPEKIMKQFASMFQDIQGEILIDR